MIYALLAGAESPHDGKLVQRFGEGQSTRRVTHSLRIPESCVDGENEREKIGGGKELVAPALVNPVDPVLVSPPAVKCVVSPARAIHRLPSTSAKKRRRLPVARFVAMENLKG
jgi:hypothetical protein